MTMIVRSSRMWQAWIWLRTRTCWPGHPQSIAPVCHARANLDVIHLDHTLMNPSLAITDPKLCAYLLTRLSRIPLSTGYSRVERPREARNSTCPTIPEFERCFLLSYHILAASALIWRQPRKSNGPWRGLCTTRASEYSKMCSQTRLRKLS